jgi:predicted ATPase
MPSTIKHLVIKNYKSLREAQFSPRALSVLVGPNSSGKSNLLDAIRFLRDFVADGQKALQRRNGFKTIVWSGDTSKRVSLELHGDLEWERETNGFEYFLEFSNRPLNASENREYLKVQNASQFRTILDFPGSGGNASLYDIEGRHLAGYPRSTAESFLRQFAARPGENQPVGFFSDYVRSWEVYDFAPPLMRDPVSTKHDLKLAPHGENLGSVLHTLRSEHPAIFRTVEEYLHTLIPESKNLLSLLTEKASTYPGIEEELLSTKIPATSMSAGTLRFLAFLAALYSPEAPPLVCFEEPENNIHPRALELLVDILKNAALRRQVIISTHSPYLLNLVEPDSVFVFDKEKAGTTITEAGTKKELTSLLRSVGLGEAWYAGTLGGVPTQDK